MHLKISSPEQAIYEGSIQKVTVPTEAGEITVLPNHQPLSSVVKPGILRIYATEEVAKDDYVMDNGAINISVSK